MTNIHILQNVVVDKAKVAEIAKTITTEELKQLLGIANSQAANIRRGDKLPSHDGLLRLMMLRETQPGDLAKVNNG